MIGMVSTKYAFRSLFRRPRRTAISVVGVGIGCAIGMIAIGYYGGAAELQIRAVSESGAGHLKVVPAGWLETKENSLRLTDWQAALAAVKATPGVKRTAMRARANGLLAFGNRTVGVEVVGVDPEAEETSNRIIKRSKLQGRYLQAGDSNAVVIGRELARRLDVELDDDLLVTMSGKGDIRSAMLRIVGLLETGSRDIDSSICHVTLNDLASITGYEGPAEIAILIDDYKLIDQMQKALSPRLPLGNTVITWMEVSPDIAANVRGDGAFFRFMNMIVIIVVMLGIMSAQLTAVLERRRELGVLTALGMKPGRIVSLILLEGLFTGLAGAVAALLIGSPVLYYLATKGLNFGAIVGGDLGIGNALFDPYVYGDLGIWIVWYALSVSVAATVIAAIYPAWFAVKTDPAEAIRTV